VSSRSAIPLQKYNDYKICAFREGLSFLDAPRPTKTSNGNGISCPDGYKVCGTGTVDTAYCAKSSERCPINDVYIASSTTVIAATYSSATLGSGQTLLFSINGSSLPAVRLRLTEGKVCANPYEKMATSGRSLYYLLDYSGYGSCSTKVGSYSTDPRYTNIGTINEAKLYEDNGVMSVINYLPRYPVSDSYKYDWNLYSGRYFAWSTQCENEKNINRQGMISLIEDSDGLSSYQKSIQIICIVFIVFSVLYIVPIITAVLASKKVRLI